MESLNERAVLAVVNENPQVKVPKSSPLLPPHLFSHLFEEHRYLGIKEKPGENADKNGKFARFGKQATYKRNSGRLATPVRINTCKHFSLRGNKAYSCGCRLNIIVKVF